MKRILLSLSLLCLASANAFAGYVFGFTGGGSGAVLTVVTDSAEPVYVHNSFDQGWYDNTGFHDPDNQNYIAGDDSVPPVTGVNAHNFFMFRLGQGIIEGNILSATLSIFNPSNGSSLPASGVVYNLWDVDWSQSDPYTTLLAGGSGLLSVYMDLGSGTNFGSRLMLPADVNGNIVINLNSDALIAIGNASNVEGTSLFAIGGSIGNSLGGREVPEPGTYALMGAGLLGLAALRRRK